MAKYDLRAKAIEKAENKEKLAQGWQFLGVNPKTGKPVNVGSFKVNGIGGCIASNAKECLAAIKENDENVILTFPAEKTDAYLKRSSLQVVQSPEAMAAHFKGMAKAEKDAAKEETAPTAAETRANAEPATSSNGQPVAG